MKKEKKLVVGLGNPGINFLNTRHNLGFKIIDYLINSLTETNFLNLSKGEILKKKQFNGEFFLITCCEQEVIFLKPQTYMNNSGECVKAFIDHYQIPLSNLLVIYDDLSLPLGTIRLRMRGSSGGHNGVLNLINCLDSLDIQRLKVGIGKNDNIRQDQWVLQTFTSEEQEKLSYTLKRIIKPIFNWIGKGMSFQQLMNSFNQKETVK